jgi:NADP-dependent aldehyde dehydrogenase
MISGKNYIGNQQSAKGNETYKTFNPELNIENENIFTQANDE